MKAGTKELTPQQNKSKAMEECIFRKLGSVVDYVKYVSPFIKLAYILNNFKCYVMYILAMQVKQKLLTLNAGFMQVLKMA